MTCVFRRSLGEVCILLGRYAVLFGGQLRTFRKIVRFPILEGQAVQVLCLTLADETNMLYETSVSIYQDTKFFTCLIRIR